MKKKNTKKTKQKKNTKKKHTITKSIENIQNQRTNGPVNAHLISWPT